MSASQYGGQRARKRKQPIKAEKMAGEYCRRRKLRSNSRVYRQLNCPR